MSKYQREVDKLVKDMGFSRTEAAMALEEAGGDVNLAVGRLLEGKYTPPPYNQTNSFGASQQQIVIPEKHSMDDSSKPTFSNLLADLRGKHEAPIVKDNPSAPSFFDLSSELNQHKLPNGVKEMPPPYEVVDKSQKLRVWEKDSNVFHFNSTDSSNSPSLPLASSSSKDTAERPSFLPQGERCDVCFNILESADDILSQGRKLYHGKCFRKKFGPKCAHCCFPLTMPDKDHDLSGRYLIYQHKDYHVECYEKYAGPRCSHCFNVIIEKLNGDFSGNWVVDGNNHYHVECYQKKLDTQWRVKNS